MAAFCEGTRLDCTLHHIVGACAGATSELLVTYIDCLWRPALPGNVCRRLGGSRDATAQEHKTDKNDEDTIEAGQNSRIQRGKNTGSKVGKVEEEMIK